MIETWSTDNFNCVFEVGLKKQLFKCHKNILSPLLKKNFEEVFDNAENYKIPILNIGPEAFAMFCEYAYNGKILNVEKYKGHTGPNEKSMCYCDSCRKAAHCFLAKFHQLCFLINKYSVTDNLKDYIVDFVENGNIKPIILRQYYLYYAFDGASWINNEGLINICKENIQGQLSYITQPIVNNMYVDHFVKVIYILFDSLMNSTSMDIFNHNRRTFCYYLFISLENFAIANELMEAIPPKIVPPKNYEFAQLPNSMDKIQELFQLLIYDERMTAEFFAVGPARSVLLKEEDELQLAKKFS